MTFVVIGEGALSAERELLLFKGRGVDRPEVQQRQAGNCIAPELRLLAPPKWGRAKALPRYGLVKAMILKRRNGLIFLAVAVLLCLIGIRLFHILFPADVRTLRVWVGGDDNPDVIRGKGWASCTLDARKIRSDSPIRMAINSKPQTIIIGGVIFNRMHLESDPRTIVYEGPDSRAVIIVWNDEKDGTLTTVGLTAVNADSLESSMPPASMPTSVPTQTR